MEPNYVIIPDFCGGYLNIIHLAAEEIKVSVESEDFESFLSTIEEKHVFRLRDCQRMATGAMNICRCENGKEVDNA